MKSGSLWSPWSVRVYTIVVISVLGLAAAAAPRLTVDPTMVKGPANAPVTIVEFSDYQ